MLTESRRSDAVLLVAAGLLLAVAGDGPDLGHYIDWAAAALTGDIFALRGNVLAPGGVPFSLASAGPGMLFAVARLSLLNLVSIGTAAYFAGWAAALVFWCSALVVLRRVAGGNGALVLFGAGALFVGTHAGFYSRSYATEVFANALVAAAWALGLSRDRWRLIDCAAAGALAGLLLVVRPYLLLYALPTLWMAAFGEGGPGSAQRTGWLPRLAAVGLPMAAAVAQYAIVNLWMTGSPLHPPYVYGGAGFSSVDLWHPQIGAVLAHPWHGLLAYHPLYAIAFVACVVQAWRSPSERWLWGATAIACLAHLWVQSAWYIWWLGGGTFGMRGMAPAALPLVAGLTAAVRHDLRSESRNATIWMRLTLVACAWSLPLLLQGATQFLTWPQLLSTERLALWLFAGLAVTWIWLAWTQRRAAATLPARELRLDVVLLTVVPVAYLVMQLTMYCDPGIRSLKAFAGALVVGGVAWLASRVRSIERRNLVVGVIILAIFVAQALVFARLAVRTERVVAGRVSPPREFKYAGASPVDELRVTYAEYREVPGFADRKAAMRRFLIRQRIDASRMAADDRRIAEQVAAAFAGDPILHDVLIEPTVAGGVVRLISREMSDPEKARAHELAAMVPGVTGVQDGID